MGNSVRSRMLQSSLGSYRAMEEGKRKMEMGMSG